jgi:spectinomycin phosphotransferase
VFPFIEARSGQFGEYPDVWSDHDSAERALLVDLLIRLHQATPSAASFAQPASLQLSQRADLESALGELDEEWVGGPFSEPARALLAGHAADIHRLVETFDHLAERVMAASTEPVITHGEPHPGNVMRANGRLLLVDWDTAGLAPPERDLWMVDTGTGDHLMRYAGESGRPIDSAAIRLYRLRWQLDDIASFVRRLRSAHRHSADTEKAWHGLAWYLESLDIRSWAG